MKKIIAISFLAIVVVGIMTVYCLPQSELFRFETVISVIGGITTLFTLLLAFLLYNKFVIDKPFFDKQKDAVFSLLDEIRDTSFLVINERYGLKFEPIKADQEFDKSLFDDYLDRLVSFSYESLIRLEAITDYRKNIYLPKTISKNLEQLSVLTPGSLDQERLNEYVFVVFKKTGRHEDHKADLKSFCKPNIFHEITVKDYHEKWEKLINSIKKWIDENSSIDIELNL